MTKTTNNTPPPVPPYIHSIAGGAGGAIGAIVTNPLEVVKTRLQSSSKKIVKNISGRKGDYMLRNIKLIINNEGKAALFKGLPITLLGAIPSRMIYFYSYNTCKGYFGIENSNSPAVHTASAISAGSSQIFLTTPFWVVKTKQQLNAHESSYSLSHCARDIYKSNGIRGFWRGVSASLMGLSETVVFFLLYERLKIEYVTNMSHKNSMTHFAALFGCTVVAKSIAASLCYPHEVVRTRLREETTKTKYRSFAQTLRQVKREDGLRGWYSGLRVHFMRIIPNNAIMMVTYEFIVHLYTANAIT